MIASSKTIVGSFGKRRMIDLLNSVGPELLRMPWCHRLLLENVFRQADDAAAISARDAMKAWLATGHSAEEIPFAPLRILMHDTTSGPALTDIAAMRDALAEAGGNPALLNPAVPMATSTDHSLALDFSGTSNALALNMAREMERNAERYSFMKWAANAIKGFRVFPPGTGIMHTINLERLATVVTSEERDGVLWAVPDTLVGTDSHTPMVNALGVLGWGVGGLEAEGVMFGVPVSLRIPDVIGVRLTGALGEGALATDLALMVTQRLRELGVAGEFVEYFGPGISTLTVGQRAVAANMAPEYGASTGCFPIDAQTLTFLRDTGRTAAAIELVETYARANALWFDATSEPPRTQVRYSKVTEIDLSALKPSLAGPSRPQDRRDTWDAAAALTLSKAALEDETVPDGAVAIAALTSCTNTTDFGLLVAAGLLARKARRLGMRPAPWVKTSLTPGSPSAVTRLRSAGVLQDLEAMGFAVAGFGCATCIGNSGPLLPMMEAALANGITPVAVLSGNRNFPGRVHSQVDQSFLASPPLVIAFALAGHAVLDIIRDPIGTDVNGAPIHLSQIWPSAVEIEAAIAAERGTTDIQEAYTQAEASPIWQALPAPASERFPWDPSSTYLRRPPFVRFAAQKTTDRRLLAHPLLVLGDDITTDHISPAGAIPAKSDAGQWLVAHGENPKDLNVYASRRGNWEVMLRGLFTNRTVINHLGPKTTAGFTIFAPTGELLPAWQAASRYADAGLPVVLIAGERYGTGSSRDWAAKGAQLLGIRAVVANSFERIHRANLVCMGILPLQLPSDWRPETINMTPGDTLEIAWNLENLAPRCEVALRLHKATGPIETGTAIALLDTRQEVELIQAGGIIPMILDRSLQSSGPLVDNHR